MTTSSVPTPLGYGELNWLNGRAGRVGTAAAIYVALCISVMLSGWGDDRVRAIVADAAYAPLVGLSVILCLLIWRHPAIDPAFRRAWGVLGLALAANLIAGAIWLYQDITLGGISKLSWADPILLAGYWLVAAAFLTFPHPPLSRIDQLRIHLDVAIILVAIWMGIWFPASQPEAGLIYSDSAISFLTPYPVMDLPMIYGMLVFVFRQPNISLRSSFGLLIGSFSLTVAADFIFSVQQFKGTFTGGTPLESLWYIAYLLFIFAGLRQYVRLKTHGSAFTGARPNPYLWLLPYLMLLFGYLLIMVEFATRATLTLTLRGLFVGAAALTLLAVVRQFIDLYEIRRLNAELVLRLKQLEETGSALNRAQHLASIGTLAAGVAHEVNNPIGVIAAATEILQRYTLNEQWKRESFLSNLARIRRSAWHASKIVRSLLAYSRGGELILNHTSARALIDDALANLPTDGDAQLTIDINPETPTILCDHDQIMQVLMNLIDNALDAVNDSTPRGTVAVAARRHTDGGILFTVTDTGPGIEAETLARIFDPFYTTKPVGKGTGLGLWICRGIVQTHDGQLCIDSQPGVGTTVSLSLPPEPHPKSLD